MKDIFLLKPKCQLLNKTIKATKKIFLNEIQLIKSILIFQSNTNVHIN